MNNLMLDKNGLKILLLTLNSGARNEFLADIRIFLDNIKNLKIQETGANLDPELSNKLFGDMTNLAKKKAISNITKGISVKGLTEEQQDLVRKNLRKEVRYYYPITSINNSLSEVESSRISKDGTKSYLLLNDIQVVLLKKISYNIFRLCNININIKDSENVLRDLNDNETNVDVLQKLHSMNTKLETVPMKSSLFNYSVSTIMESETVSSLINYLGKRKSESCKAEINSFFNSMDIERNNVLKSFIKELQTSEIYLDFDSLSEILPEDLDSEDSTLNDENLSEFFAGYLYADFCVYFDEILEDVEKEYSISYDKFDACLYIQELIDLGFTGIGYTLKTILNTLPVDSLSVNYVDSKTLESRKNNQNIKFILGPLRAILNNEIFVERGLNNVF